MKRWNIEVSYCVPVAESGEVTDCTVQPSVSPRRRAVCVDKSCDHMKFRFASGFCYAQSFQDDCPL